jgi:mono/diheme cytochrome c family protein
MRRYGQMRLRILSILVTGLCVVYDATVLNGTIEARVAIRPDTTARVQTKSVSDGVYTDAQATRGAITYRNDCGACHGETLGGSNLAPTLVGDAFVQEWLGKTAADLFERVRETMPQDDPGRLDPRQYADILAYIFKATGFPTGETELGDEVGALGRILIRSKATDF